MQILIYKDFSDNYDVKEIQPGKVRDVLSAYCNDNHAIIVNGNKAGADTVLCEDDCVIVRSVPGVTGALIITGVILTGAAVAGGVYAYKAKKDAEDAKREAEKLAKNLRNMGDSVDNLPTMAGSSNTTSKGKTQPYLMGHRLHTPYLITDAWRDRKGSEYHPAQDVNYTVRISGRVEWSAIFVDANIEIKFDKPLENAVTVTYLKTSWTIAKGETYSTKKIHHGESYKKYDLNALSIGNAGISLTRSGKDKQEIKESDNTRSINLTNPSYWDDSCPEYTYRILQGGFRKQAIKEIRGDSNVLVSFPDYDTETPDGIYDCASDMFPESSVEIVQDGKDFVTPEFNTKMYSQEVNSTVLFSDDEKYEPLIYTLPINAIDLNMALNFSGGLYLRNGEGAKVEREVELAVSYSVDGGENYERLPAQFNGDGKIKRNYKNEFYMVLNHRFEDAEIKNACRTNTGIMIRVETITKKYDGSGSASDNMIIAYLRNSLCNVFKARKEEGAEIVPYRLLEESVDSQSLKIGLKIKTTQSNEDKIRKIQIDTYGMCRVPEITETEEGKVYSWPEDKEEKTITRNPAAWCLEVLTSETHRPSMVTDEGENIDLDSFGEWFEYCRDNNLNIDAVLLNGDTKEKVLNDICSVGNAVLYKSIYGKIAVAIDDKKSNAIAVLNQQNIISFSAEKDMTRVMDGYRITHMVSDYWKEDTVCVMRNGDINPEHRDPQANITEISLSNIIAEKNDNSQIIKYARRKINADILRTHRFNIEVGEEGFFFTPFSKVLVQHPALYIGLGSTTIQSLIIKNGYIMGLNLYDPIEWTSDKIYGLVINAVCDNYAKELNVIYTAEKEGLNHKILFETPISTTADVIPYGGNVASYGLLNDKGEFKTITTEVTITAIQKTKKGIKLSGVDYSDALFDYGEIPEYHSNLTTPGITEPAAEKEYATINDVLDTTADMDGKIYEALQKATAAEEMAANLAENPVIYSSISSCGIAVNDNDIVTKPQEIAFTVYARQGEEDLDFYFIQDEIRKNLPEGIKFRIDNHTVILTIEEGTVVTTETLNFPITFKAFKYNFEYGDEEGYGYTDNDKWVGYEGPLTPDTYGVREQQLFETRYELGFTLIGVQGGRYLGPVVSVGKDSITILNQDGSTTEKAVSTLIIGDYFTFSAEDFESDLEQGGTFYQSQVYEFLGINEGRKYMWTEDSISEHCGGTLSDVLNVAKESLSRNNSNATQFLDHLTSNSIFVDMLVANKAFIDSLAARMITLQRNAQGQGGLIKSANYNGTIKEDGSIDKEHYGTEGWAVDFNGTADFVDVNLTNGNFEGRISTGSFYVKNVKPLDEVTDHSNGFNLLTTDEYKLLNEAVESPSGSLTGNNFIARVGSFICNFSGYISLPHIMYGFIPKKAGVYKLIIAKTSPLNDEIEIISSDELNISTINQYNYLNIKGFNLKVKDEDIVTVAVYIKTNTSASITKGKTGTICEFTVGETEIYIKERLSTLRPLLAVPIKTNHQTEIKIFQKLLDTRDVVVSFALD